MEGDNSALLPSYSNKSAKALEEFSIEPTKEIPKVLNEIIIELAKTGLSCYKWKHLRVLIESYFRKVLIEYGDDGENAISAEDRNQLYNELRHFEDPPFTLQRICELLVSPKSHYRNAKIWVFSVNKLVNVALTNKTLDKEEYNEAIAEIHDAYNTVVAIERLGSKRGETKSKSKRGGEEEEESSEESMEESSEETHPKSKDKKNSGDGEIIEEHSESTSESMEEDV